MFFFWKKKQDEIYPSFNTRIFSSVIDSTIAAIVLIPILYWGLPLLYNGTTPSQKLGIIMDNIAKNMAGKNVSLMENANFKEFIDNHWISIVMEKLLQVLVLATMTFVFWLKTNSTPGKLLFSIKILDAKTLQPPSFFQLVIRILSYTVSVLPFCLGIFYIAFNKRRRAWHDLIAGTVVVYEKKLERAIVKQLPIL